MASVCKRLGLGLGLLTWLRMSHSILQRKSSSLPQPLQLQRKECRFQAKRLCLLGVIPVVKAASEDDGSSTDDHYQPFEPNDARLRSSECLKNAAGLSVDSSSAVLSQTVYAIINAEKQYTELLIALIQLMDYQVQVLGHEKEEQRIADIILEARDAINKLKKRRQDLALLFSSVEKLADATAEVAFATGCTYASTSAGERLYSAQQEVKKVLAASEKAEKEVAMAEAELIAHVTKHEEKVKLEKLQDGQTVVFDDEDDLKTTDGSVESEGKED